MKSKILKIFFMLICVFSLSACRCSFLELKDENPETSLPEDGDESNGDVNSGVSVPWTDICKEDSNACPKYNPSSVTYSSLQAAYNNTVKSVVTIFAYSTSMINPISSGSGFIYATSSDNGYVYILTNGHVVESESTITALEVVYSNGVRVKASSLAYNIEEDVAVVKANVEPNGNYTVASLGNSDEISVGETIYTIGTPLSLNHNNNLTSGVVSGVNVTVSTDDDEDGVYTNMYMTQVDAALSSGNSGGPLFNMNGEVIGINTLKMTDSGNNVLESFNFSIRINKAIKVANSLLITGKYQRPLIGISVYDIKNMSLTQREIYHISSNIHYGLFVSSVVVDSAAFNIIPTNVIVTKINDVTILGMEDFSVELLNYLKDDKIKITIIDPDGSNEVVKDVTLR